MEKLEALSINNTSQWILCRGNEQGTIVFFVHGGPGSPLMMFSTAFDEELVNRLLVVHWDQRGAGKSFSEEVFQPQLRIEDHVQDGLEVVKHLKSKYPDKKIILVGHSWGSVLAAQMVQKSPQSFASFISVGTVTDYERADQIKYEFLSKIPAAPKSLTKPPYLKWSEALEVSQLLIAEQRIFHNLPLEDLNRGVMATKHYSIDELRQQSRGAEKSFTAFIQELSSYRALKEVPEIPIPTYFVQGSFDLATPTELVKTYFSQVRAPQGKEYIEFPKSAHFPMYEEPERFLQLLQKIAD